jgi:hypothetical protein
MTTMKHRALLLLFALVAATALAGVARAAPAAFLDSAAVLAVAAPDGFSDGTDGAVATPEGFSDGTDAVVVSAVAPEGFSDGTDAVVVSAVAAPAGFSDGTEGFSDGTDGLVVIEAPAAG